MTYLKSNKIVTKLLVLAMFVSMFALAIKPVLAADLINENIALSNIEKSASTNMLIQFSLDSATTFDAAETIIVDLDKDGTGYIVDGAGTVAGDFDMTVVKSSSPVEQSMLATCAAGTDNVSFAVNDTTGVITFTACATYTASDAGAAISIQYGDNATTGGTGTNRVTNPASAGTVTTNITAASDTGSALVAIQNDATIALTATATPTLTVDFDTPVGGVACADTANLAVNAGTLSTTAVNTSGPNDNMERLCMDFATNSTALTVVQISSTAPANSQSDTISSATAAMAAGTENFGACAGVTASGLTEVNPYDGATCALNGENNNVGQLTTTPASIWTAAGATASGTSEIYFSMAASATTEPGSYSATATVNTNTTF